MHELSYFNVFQNLLKYTCIDETKNSAVTNLQSTKKEYKTTILTERGFSNMSIHNNSMNINSYEQAGPRKEKSKLERLK